MERIRTKRALARAIKELILAEDHWNQRIWISASYFDASSATGTQLRKMLSANVCGTTACVAGNAVILTLPKSSKYDYAMDEVIAADGEITRVTDYAQEVMGLTWDEADWLFYSHRSKQDVLDALDLLIEGKNLDTLLDRW